MSFIALLLVSITIYAVSPDCPNVIQLARGLGMPSKQPAIWTALQSDCCTASDITCISQRVTVISWSNKSLNGVINGTAIPSSLTHLLLSGNAITGNVPNALHVGLVYLWLNGNQMSGDLPSFPSSLKFLQLGYPGVPGNHFSGTLRLNIPIYLFINDNWITDVVIQDSSQLAPSLCDLSNNPLLGNTNIAGLAICTKNGFYSAGLLPMTMSTLALIGTATELGTSVGSMVATNALATITTAVVTTVLTTTSIQGIHITSSGMTVNGTSTADLEWTSTLGTVQFVSIKNKFAFNLFMAVRVLLNGMLLAAVLNRTPFLRELKRKLKKRKTNEDWLGV